MHQWSTGKSAANKIKLKSKQGSTPISWLAIGGHCGGGNQVGTTKKRFGVDGLFDVAVQKDNSKNTFASAVKKQGPPRCWFCRGAKVFAFGCNTNVFASDFADRVLRENATASCTNFYMMVEYEGRGTEYAGGKFNFSTTLSRNTPISVQAGSTFDEVIGLDGDRGWSQYDGKQ